MSDEQNTPADEPAKKIIETPLDLSGAATADDDATAVMQTQTTVIETESGTITETTLDLSGGGKPAATASGGASATERIRKARGSTAPTTRARPEDASALRGKKTDEAVDAGGLRPVRDGKQTVSLAITLFLVAAIIGGIAAILAWHPGAPGRGDNLAFVDRSESADVIAQYSKNGCVPFRYKYQSITEDMKQARTHMTGEAQKAFDETAETNRKLVVQSQANSDCHVDYVGLQSLEGDRAEVIAILIIQVTNVQGVLDSVAPRLAVSLDRHGDEWLISEVKNVG